MVKWAWVKLESWWLEASPRRMASFIYACFFRGRYDPVCLPVCLRHSLAETEQIKVAAEVPKVLHIISISLKQSWGVQRLDCEWYKYSSGLEWLHQSKKLLQKNDRQNDFFFIFCCIFYLFHLSLSLSSAISLLSLHSAAKLPYEL